MNSLSENIGQAIADFDGIKTAIEDKGVDVGNVSTSEYANKISQIQTGQELFFTSAGKCYPANLVFSDNVTSIPNNAYSNCANLTNITIPNSVTTIGANAFNGCVDLATVTILNGVTSIGSQAFYSCSSLTSVSIPNTVTSFGANVFLGCANLENVHFENGFNCTGVNFTNNRNLTHQSLVEMLNALADLTGQTAKTLTLGTINLPKLSAEEKQIATNKNWNLA